jgi:CBS domain-containing protein
LLAVFGGTGEIFILMFGRSTMKAKDIMTKNVVTVTPDTLIEDIVKLMINHRISGLPVVDEKGKVVGIVSEKDLILKERGFPFSVLKVPHLIDRLINLENFAEEIAEARKKTAADVMTTDVIYAQPDDTVGHVAWEMVQTNHNRIPVIEDGVLIGIITRADIIRIYAKE